VNKKILLSSVGVLFSLLLFFGILFGIYNIYCDYFGDKYSEDSICFDINFRCKVECGNFGRNFTGMINDCLCDCGDGWVSICSGFFYPKNISEVK